MGGKTYGLTGVILQGQVVELELMMLFALAYCDLSDAGIRASLGVSGVCALLLK